MQNCLSLMFTYGMNEFSGEWSFKVGLPAKSGVSGAIMIVIPGIMGIATWSPPVDSFANSVRGVAFAKGLISRYNFHVFSDSRCDCPPYFPDRSSGDKDTTAGYPQRRGIRRSGFKETAQGEEIRPEALTWYH